MSINENFVVLPKNYCNSQEIGNSIRNCDTTTKHLTVTGTTSISGTLNTDCIDTITGTTLKLGPSLATKIEVADAGVITEIQGTLDVIGATNFQSGETLFTNTSDSTIWVKADIDNTTETDQASLLLSQDGQKVWAVVATDDNNKLSIRAGSDGTGPAGTGDILFWTRGETSAAITGIDDTLVDAQSLGTNIMTLSDTNVNILGDLDRISAGTLKLGASTANRVEIADTGITTEVQGLLDAVENITTNEIDTRTATTLFLGKSTTNKVEIADTGITTEVQGLLDAVENITTNEIDTRTAGTLTLGKSTATRVEIGDAGVTTDIEGNLIAASTSSFIDDATFEAGINSLDTTDSTSVTTGAIYTLGGLGVGKDIYCGGDLTVLNETVDATASILVQAKGDAHLWLKADIDNTATPTESDHPIIALSQDGQAFWSTIGYDDDALFNDLIIRAGSISGASADILFYVDGDSGGSFTSPRGGLGTGTNIMTLTSTSATIDGTLASGTITVDGVLISQPTTGTEGGEIQLHHRTASQGKWVLDSTDSDKLRLFGTDPADDSSGFTWLLLDHNATNVDATIAGGLLDINMTDDITIDTTDTTDGIKIGTSTSGVPITIGHTISETTVADNFNVSGTTNLGAVDSMNVTATGGVTINNTTQSTSDTTGSLKVTGGVGIAKDVFIGGSLDVNTITNTGDITTESLTDCTVWIKADTDNAVSEDDDGNLLITKDGELVWGTIGFDNSAAGNDLIIRAGQSTSGNGNIELWCGGVGTVTDISDTQGASNGTNVLRLTEDEVEVSNELKLQRGTVTQATDIFTSVTVNAQFGTITTANDILNANTNFSFTVNNNYVTANSIVLLTLNEFDTGSPFEGLLLRCRGIASGSFQLHLMNSLAIGNYSGTLEIGFMVMNDASI
jgi:hypothetical protein